MLKVQDSSLPRSPAFLFQNVHKFLSTFLPANPLPENRQLHDIINVKYEGTITFSDNKSNRAQFICIPPDAPVAQVKTLILRHWCKEQPSLVISITGGAKNYNMTGKLLRAFRRGLRKVATTTGAWIITGGMNTGIMKLVGEIVPTNPNHSRPIHIIGIGTWGCVSNFQQLRVKRENVNYVKPRAEEKGTAPLEPNHTEFIFVDNGTEREYGGEITFRANLERAIAGDFFAPQTASSANNSLPILTRKASVRAETSDLVPVVLLVVEGGPNTVRTVHEAVVENHIPAVFIQGTGRCCDLFAEALRQYDKYFAMIRSNESISGAGPKTPQTIAQELKNKLREVLKEKILEISGADVKTGKKKRNKSKVNGESQQNEGDSTDYFELVYQCIEKRRHFLNIVSLNARDPVEPDIDVAILKALLNATSDAQSITNHNQRKYEQFRLALEWKRVDIVKKHIMTQEEDWKNPLLSELFEKALHRKQTDFVKLFLDHDFPLTNLFRDKNKLLLLYENSMNQRYKIEVQNDDPLHTIYKNIIQPLIGDFFEVDVALNTRVPHSTQLNDAQTTPLLRSCCGANNRNQQCQNQTSVESYDNVATGSGLLDVDKELYLWSVITERHELNLLFWMRVKNKICAALVAVIIYRKYGRKRNDTRYYQKAEEFENLAVEILDRFYQSDAGVCTKAIIRQIPSYGNATWLDLAVKAKAKQFIAHRAVQDVLTNIWFGFIDHRQSHMKIIFSTFMLWYSGFLIYHDTIVKTNAQKTFLESLLQRSNVLKSNETFDEAHSFQGTPDEIRLGLMDDVVDQNFTPVAFHDVSCCEKLQTRLKNYFVNILKFLAAPYVKYLYSLYFHIAFLLLFSYTLLCDFFPLYDIDSDACGPISDPEKGDNAPKIQSLDSNRSIVNATIQYGLQKHDHPALGEYIIFVWVSTLLCEEIRQAFNETGPSTFKKFSTYFSAFWNRLDVAAILIFYCGFGLRLNKSTQCFCAARIVLAVDLCIWFIRTLEIFAAIKQLGPKLIMIGKMVNDLKSYMLMLTVFILGFGVSSYSLINGTQEFDWHLPRKIINVAYWQMFGEINSLDLFENNYQANGYALFILLVIYMAIVSILLVNLLIAMLSNIFDRLQTNTDRIWKFQRYELICEYLSRPSLPPPFILLSHLWQLILFILLKCIGSPCIQKIYNEHIRRTTYKTEHREQFASVIEKAEDALVDDDYSTYSRSGEAINEENEIDQEPIVTPQEITLKKMQTLENQVQVIRDQLQVTRDEQNQILNYLDCILEGIQHMSENNIRMPGKRHIEADESLDETLSNTVYQRGAVRRESSIEEVQSANIFAFNKNQ